MGDQKTRAEQIYADYLARRSAGESTSFEALCAEHPELEGDLRRLAGLPGRDELRRRAKSIAEHLQRLPLAARSPALDELCRDDRTLEAAVLGVLESLVANDDFLRAPSVAQRVEQLFGAGAAPQVTLDPPGRPTGSRLVERLTSAEPGTSRYELKGEVARGGMGAILRVWDKDLRRNLAMKVILGRADVTGGETPAVDDRTLGRFLEEAQVTGQLEHPGIVPVHELGLDSTGRVYFTMKLVKGSDLAETFARVRDPDDREWTLTRALTVMLHICDALAYAHDKGVVHRDLKPANVMVGRFGETYVMDWGLAKILGAQLEKDLRLRSEAASVEIRSERQEAAAATPESSLVTMDGDVVGTPSYMSPEQALGRIDDMGPRSDVYAVGAMLYELLTGQAPFVDPGERPSPFAILAKVQAGAPRPIRELDASAPPELVAICEKAMSRDIDQRYADMSAMANDIRAYFDRDVRRGKSTLQTSWTLRIASGILAFVWWGGWVGISLFLLLSVLGKFEGYFSVPVVFGYDFDPPIAELTRPDGEALRTDDVRTTVRLPLDSGALQVLWAAASLVQMGMALIVIQCVRRIISSAKSGNPFAPRNAVRLRWIGAILIVFGVSYQAFGFALPHLVEGTLRMHEHVVIRSDPSWELIFFGLLTLILASVFRLGTALDGSRGRS